MNIPPAHNAGAVEQLRDGIGQRDAQIRDLLALLQFRASPAERAAIAGAAPAAPAAPAADPDEPRWLAAMAEAAAGCAAEHEASRRGFQRGFCFAERETAQLAITAVDAVRAGREMVAEAFAEAARAAEVCARRVRAAEARERAGREAAARAEEEARRARRAEAAAVARLRAALSERAGGPAPAQQASTPPPASFARGSSPGFSFRTPAAAADDGGDTHGGHSSAAVPLSKAGRGPVHAQLTVDPAGRVLVSLLVDWSVCPSWVSAQDQLKGAGCRPPALPPEPLFPAFRAHADACPDASLPHPPPHGSE